MVSPERYDPEASDTILIFCPGCGEEIAIFQDGTVAEPRDKPVEPGVIPSLLDAAFKKHYCDANDREWVCTHCETRYDDEDLAENCCAFAAPRSDSMLVSEFDPDSDKHY